MLAERNIQWLPRRGDSLVDPHRRGRVREQDLVAHNTRSLSASGENDVTRRTRRTYDVGTLPSTRKRTGRMDGLPGWQVRRWPKVPDGAIPIRVVPPALTRDIPGVAMRRVHEQGLALLVEIDDVILRGAEYDSEGVGFSASLRKMGWDAQDVDLDPYKVREDRERR